MIRCYDKGEDTLLIEDHRQSSTADQPDSRKLGAMIRGGDTQAFRVLYEQYGGRIKGYLKQMTGSAESAEDLMQEVFVAAYHGRSAYRGDTSALSWLLGIAHRRWRDANRKSTVSTVELRESMVDTEGGKPLADRVLDAITLTSALSTLDDAYREALFLVASEGLTYREASQVTGEPVGTVKWRVSIAIRRLRSELMREEGHGDELQRALP